METAVRQRPRDVMYVPVLCSALMLIALIGCGGGSHSTTSSTGTTTGASSGTTATTGTSGTSTTSTSGTSTTGTGTAGVSGGSTGSGSGGAASSSGGGGSTGATFVYSAVYTDGGGVTAYQQDASGNLTGVSGSPYLQQAAASLGALATNNGSVYLANNAQNTYTSQLVEYKADASTGALTQAGTFDAGAGSSGDSQVRRLLVSPSGKNMYGIFQWTIVSYALASDGTPTVLNSTAPSTDSVWAFDVIPNRHFAYAAIQNGNPKQGFQIPQIALLTVNADGSLTNSKPSVTLSNASGIPGDLKVDPSGKYVVVSNGQSNEQLSVYAIQGDGSLTEVPGSPFATGSQELRFMGFDSTGKFLYVVNQQAAQPQAENVEVFSFNSSTGALAQVQNLNQPTEQNVTWLQVDGNYVYLTNVNGGASSTITVFSRDPNTGTLSQVAAQSVPKAVGETAVAHF